MKWQGLPVVILGTGDVARELIYLIEEINLACCQPVYQVQAVAAENEETAGQWSGDVPVIAEADLAAFAGRFPLLGAAIPIGSPMVKKKIYQKIKTIPHLVYPNFVHPHINLRNIRLGMGNIIQENVSISIGAELGDFNLLNYGCFLGHDVKIEDFTVVGPQAKVCGRVAVGGESLIGVGATVLQGLTIGRRAVVGAGAVVTCDTAAGETVLGIPARPKQQE